MRKGLTPDERFAAAKRIAIETPLLGLERELAGFYADPRMGSDERAHIALTIAARAYNADAFETAREWALRALNEGPWADAFDILAAVDAALERFEDAGTWLWISKFASVDGLRSRYRRPARLGDEQREELKRSLEKILRPVFSSEVPGTFHVVVPYHNGAKTIVGCLQSICDQRQALDMAPGAKINIIVADDASDNHSRDLVEHFCAQDHPGVTIKKAFSPTRQYAMKNAWDAIKNTPMEPSDVVVIVAGDDSIEPRALNRIAQHYYAGAWLTYGSWRYKDGDVGWARPYPAKAVRDNTIRSQPFLGTAMQSFKRALFDHITEDELKINGEWPQVSGDVALMVPLIELAGQRAFFIYDPIYIYNVTDQADHKIRPQEQIDTRDYFLSKKPRQPLKEL